MNKEKAMQNGIVYIPQYKKIWYSITKFEKYPEMATEGVGRAFLYLVYLMFLFALIFTIALLIKFHFLANEGISFIDKNFTQINYQDGNLNINTENENITTKFANIVINTKDITEEQIKQYENRSNFAKTEIIFLKEKAILKYNDESINILYKDFFDRLQITQFEKDTLTSFLQDELNSPAIYLIYGIIIIIYMLMAYFIATLMDIVILSLFGWITTFFAKIQIRYRAIFNMSVYAITLSVVLKLAYYITKLYTGFDVKYFDLMYSAISFICLTAAIFMIKSDVIRQQIELMKMIEIKKKEQENSEEEQNQEEKNKQDDKDKETEKENKENNDSEEEKGQGTAEPNVSN